MTYQKEIDGTKKYIFKQVISYKSFSLITCVNGLECLLPLRIPSI